MGLFGKKEAEVVAPVVETKKTEGTIIAPGMTFVGDFVTEEELDIQGTVKGSVTSSVNARVSEGGKHMGKMDVNSLYVDGVLDSDVVCTNTTTLSDTARFKGSLKTANLDAAHGSTFEGSLTLEAKKSAQTQEDKAE